MTIDVEARPVDVAQQRVDVLLGTAVVPVAMSSTTRMRPPPAAPAGRARRDMGR